jgi:hypothetical protein
LLSWELAGTLALPVATVNAPHLDSATTESPLDTSPCYMSVLADT